MAAFISHVPPLPFSASLHHSSFVHATSPKRPSAHALRRRVTPPPTAFPPRRLPPRACASLNPSAPAAGQHKPDAEPPGAAPASPSPTAREVLAELCDGLRRLARPFWQGPEKRSAMLWTVACVALAFLDSVTGVSISFVQRFFWNTLNAKDVSKFRQILALYAVVVLIAPFVITGFTWVKERLALAWRRALTEHLLKRYFSSLNYYKLSLGNSPVDNPDQRIADDVNKFTARAVDFIMVATISVFDLVIFSVILYRIYRPLYFILIAYAAIGSAIIALAGRNLVRLNRQQVMREADLRFGLVRVRESTESIAFYAGEKAELSELGARFVAAVRNNVSLLGLRRNVKYLSVSYLYWVQVLPTAVIAPQYFAGVVKLGTLSQVYFSFNRVLSSLSLVVSQYTALAEFAAGVRRLRDLSDALARGEATPPGPRIRTTLDSSAHAGQLKLSHVSVQTPTHPPRALARDVSLAVARGDRLLIVGPSGVGKTSLVRALCGLWEDGGGSVERPGPGQTYFLPQRPFVMLGSLRDNVLYGAPDGCDRTDGAVVAALQRANLAYLLDRDGGLDAPGELLSRRLSLGEQQRLAFARIAVAAPRLVVLDESTSALDLRNERAMYALVREIGATCVSVGNRPSLLQFHDRVLRLDDDGAWQLQTIDEARLGEGESLPV